MLEATLLSEPDRNATETSDLATRRGAASSVS
jgi:hypothetical protein